MAMPAASAAAITSASRIEPPGWITAFAPAAIAASNPSAKGKNASDATTQPVKSSPAAAPRQAAMREEFDPVHLPRTDPDRRVVLGVNDGIGLHMLGHAEREKQILDLSRRRRPLRDDF